jgi:SAM-dependent methyltransferase
MRQLIPADVRTGLLLGVTPEFADLFPQVVAIDRSPDMVGAIWPGDTADRRSVVADWRCMPFEDGAFDAVVCDLGLTLLPYPDELAKGLREVGRVLSPAGTAVFRYTLMPDETVTDDEVLALCEGRDTLQWRLPVHLAQHTGRRNILAGEAYAWFEQLVPDRVSFLAERGWTEHHLGGIEMFRDSKMPFSFLQKAEFESFASNYFAGVEWHSSGNYPMAELNPFVRLSRPVAAS